MAYVREPAPGRTELVIARDDAGAAHVVAARDAPLSYFGGVAFIEAFSPAWSPDGSTIALVGYRGVGMGQVVFVEVATGTENTVDAGPVPLGLAWLDGETLLLSWLDKGSAPAQLWSLSYPGGEFRRVTNDTSQYFGVSVTADRREAVASRNEASFGIWASERRGDWRQIVPTTPAKGPPATAVRWIGDDLLLTPSTGSGWGLTRWRASTGATEMLAPGGGRPSVSRDGSTILYNDVDTGELWRMDGDGSARVLLGPRTGDTSITPDGEHVLVADVPSATVRLLRADGMGSPREVTRGRVRGRGEVSSNGERVAFDAFDEQNRPVIAVCDLAACSVRQTLPPRGTWHWTPGGDGLAYVDPLTANLWVQPIAGGTPTQLTSFPDDGLEIWDFDWSADGERLAVARARVSRNIVLFRGLRPSK
jgi:Tol biopolymer transport system component